MPKSVVRLFAIGWLVAALVACSDKRALDRPTLQVIAAEATALLKPSTGRTDNRFSEEVPVDQLPSTIRALKPQSVRATPEGLNIMIGSFFVEEWGYFAPRDVVSFSPESFGDPSFEHVGEGVNWYEIKG